MKVKALYLSFILAFIGPIIFAQTKRSSFSGKELLYDLGYLRESLEDAHYDLYAYTSKGKLDSTFHKVQRSIKKDSFTLLEATSLFQRFISEVNNGHTYIDFPGQSYGEYAYAGGTVFPLELAFEDEQHLVRKNWSGNDSIKEGSEVLSINGIPIAQILDRIYPQVSAERPYFKKAKIELLSFPRYYWQVFGKQEEFEVGIRSHGEVSEYFLKAVDVIDGYEMKRTEVINPAMELEFIGTSAYLNPGGFSGDESRFRRFIDSAFAEIRAKKSSDLIVDLRNNPGGDDSFSDYLVSYFADQPFRWNSRFTLKTSSFLKEHVRKNYDTTQVFWQEVLRHKDGEVYPYEFDEYQPQPEQKRFKGEVYVLVNRQSHSQSAVTAAQIQDYGFGTIVGEETGDYPSLYASIFQYPLPRTGIPVNVSKGYIVRVNGSTREEGVIPDLYIRDHLLDEEDEILEGLLEQLDQME